jgi:hypothetical protein
MALLGVISSGYEYYRQYRDRLFAALATLVAFATVMLFASDSLTGFSELGVAALTIAVLLLVYLSVGAEVWAPQRPAEVYQEARDHPRFDQQAQALEAQWDYLQQHGFSEEDTARSLLPLKFDALDVYRSCYGMQLLKRSALRLMALACVALVFADITRILVLNGGHPYGGELTVHSGLVDYAYFTFVSVATIGYGDIAPVSGVARGISIAFVLVIVTYILLFINYVWMQESRRERLLVEYLSTRF